MTASAARYQRYAGEGGTADVRGRGFSRSSTPPPRTGGHAGANGHVPSRTRAGGLARWTKGGSGCRPTLVRKHRRDGRPGESFPLPIVPGGLSSQTRDEGQRLRPPVRELWPSDLTCVACSTVIASTRCFPGTTRSANALGEWASPIQRFGRPFRGSRWTADFRLSGKPAWVLNGLQTIRTSQCGSSVRSRWGKTPLARKGCLQRGDKRPASSRNHSRLVLFGCYEAPFRRSSGT